MSKHDQRHGHEADAGIGDQSNAAQEAITMDQCTHHIPGRLRLKFPQLRNQSGRAQQLASAIRAVDGVRSVEISKLTGSLLIRYDATHLSLDKFFNALPQAENAREVRNQPAACASSKCRHRTIRQTDSLTSWST